MTPTIPRQARQQYEADGFYIVPRPIFPPDLLSRAVGGMDAIRRGEYDTGLSPCPSIWQPGDDPQRLCKIEQPQFASQALRDLFAYPALGQWAAEITGASMVQIWWVQLLYKPSDSEAATSIGWHQDRHYWGAWEEGSELFTAWIALSKVDAKSGPMRFVRGSHRWGLLKEGDFYAQDLSGQRRAMTIPDGERWEEVTALLPPGGVSFHDDYVLHASGPNRSGAPRRSFAVHLRTQNARPADGKRAGLTEFIDNTELCPVIYGSL